MKKLLEVTLERNGEIRFDTDVDVMKDPSIVHETTMLAMLSMTTRLWGGNETSVLAILRALSLADLAVSVNRKEMVTMMDAVSKQYANAFRETQKEFVKRGEMAVFAPGVKPKAKTKN